MLENFGGRGALEGVAEVGIIALAEADEIGSARGARAKDCGGDRANFEWSRTGPFFDEMIANGRAATKGDRFAREATVRGRIDDRWLGQSLLLFSHRIVRAGDAADLEIVAVRIEDVEARIAGDVVARVGLRIVF